MGCRIAVSQSGILVVLLLNASSNGNESIIDHKVRRAETIVMFQLHSILTT